MFHKILIANRGLSAVRLIRVLREMGISSVAVYSEADEKSLHVMLADESELIGPAPYKESYLNIDAILQAAEKHGADAVCAGNGVLSESAAFAQRCEDAGIRLIGSDGMLSRRLSDRAGLKETLSKAGIPVLPGLKGAVQDGKEAFREAKKIGFPVTIRSACGGGEKGLRVAGNKAEFEELFEAAQQEAIRAFADDRMCLEKALRAPRRIEIPVLADGYGTIRFLPERDASLAKDGRSILRESPCEALSAALRTRMGRAAVKAAKLLSFRGVGTVRFLLDQASDFYFDAFCPGFQAEYAVTDEVSGIDLIKMAVLLAAGEKLTLLQKDLKPSRHAISCGIHLGPTDKEPCKARIEELHLPGGHGVRVDTMLYSGYEIPQYYDALLAELTVLGSDRAETCAKLRAALGELVVDGPLTDLEFLYDLAGHKAFTADRITVDFMENYFPGK